MIVRLTSVKYRPTFSDFYIAFLYIFFLLGCWEIVLFLKIEIYIAVFKDLSMVDFIVFSFRNWGELLLVVWIKVWEAGFSTHSKLGLHSHSQIPSLQDSANPESSASSHFLLLTCTHTYAEPPLYTHTCTSYMFLFKNADDAETHTSYTCYYLFDYKTWKKP